MSLPAASSHIPSCALLVGGRGFLARHLMSALSAAGVERVIGTGRAASGPAVLNHYERVDFFDRNVSDQLRRLLEEHRPSWIFHLVGGPRPEAGATLVDNLVAAGYLFDAIRMTTLQPVVVVVGSAAEYGVPNAADGVLSEDDDCHPIHPYGIAKYAQTILAQQAAEQGMAVSIARIFNLVGPGISPAFFPGAILQRLRDATLRGDFLIEVGNIETARDFVAVQDAAQALISLASLNAAGEVFNVCSGIATRMGHLLEVYRDSLEPRLSWRPNPRFMRKDDPARVVGDPSKIHNATGWRPRVSVSESLREAAHEAQSTWK